MKDWLEILVLIITIITFIFPVFFPVGTINGFETYDVRYKKELRNILIFIAVFILLSMTLGTYKIWGLYRNDTSVINFMGIAFIIAGIIWIVGYIKRRVNSKYKQNRNIIYYCVVGLILSGIAIFLQNRDISILISVALFSLGMFFLDFIIDGAHNPKLYYRSEDGKIIYIYYRLDDDNFLCGDKKNANLCEWYVVKNKDEIYREKLEIVSGDEKVQNLQEMQNKKSINSEENTQGENVEKVKMHHNVAKIDKKRNCSNHSKK